MALLEKADGTTQKLEDEGSWGKAVHYFDPEQHQITALMTAVATGRPLLVRGEPGVGKSQLARAAAAVLKRRFITAVVQPDTEYTDLLWRLDHTRRLTDAQLGKAARLEGLQNYIAPGAIWWAYNWAVASANLRGFASFSA